MSSATNGILQENMAFSLENFKRLQSENKELEKQMNAIKNNYNIATHEATQLKVEHFQKLTHKFLRKEIMQQVKSAYKL